MSSDIEILGTGAFQDWVCLGWEVQRALKQGQCQTMAKDPSAQGLGGQQSCEPVTVLCLKHCSLGSG